MRYVVRCDTLAGKWLVVDTLTVEQTVGCHERQAGAVFQAESEERRWRRFGAGTENFALMSPDADSCSSAN
ncbi:MAG: hypothetical protein HOH04_06850 [Rhodospirillaceae bacterium]|jgi:hypothetical protein|nr:hypothetical protein [Rhodospirillaceae bacterium]